MRAKEDVEVKQLSLRVPLPLYRLLMACAKSNYMSMNSFMVQRLWQAVRRWEDPATGELVINQVQLPGQVGVDVEVEDWFCYHASHGDGVEARECVKVTKPTSLAKHKRMWVNFKTGEEGYDG